MKGPEKSLLIFLCCLVLRSPLVAQGEPAHSETSPLFLFTSAKEVTGMKNTHFIVHTGSDAAASTLISFDQQRPRLRYFPVGTQRAGRIVKVWYQRVDYDEPDFKESRTLCYGYFDQYGKWWRPDLDLFGMSWKDPHNVVMLRNPSETEKNYFNVHAIYKDALEHYKMIYWDASAKGKSGAHLAYSVDGIHWDKKQSDTAVFTVRNDAFTGIRDLETGDYLLYQQTWDEWPDKPILDNIRTKRRKISLRISADFEHWTSPKTMLKADAFDSANVEFYYFRAFPYGRGYGGLLLKYWADPDPMNQFKHSAFSETELLFSDDGINWDRPYRHTDMGFFPLADPFEMNGKLQFIPWLVSFTEDAHAKLRLEERKAGKEWLLRHNRKFAPFGGDSGGSMQVLKFEKDRLVGCGTTSTGNFSTKYFNLESDTLFVNINALSGSTTIEIQDEKGTAIPGFEARKCSIAAKDDVLYRLKWGTSSLNALKGKRIRLTFNMHNSELFGLYGIDRKSGGDR